MRFNGDRLFQNVHDCALRNMRYQEIVTVDGAWKSRSQTKLKGSHDGGEKFEWLTEPKSLNGGEKFEVCLVSNLRIDVAHVVGLFFLCLLVLIRTRLVHLEVLPTRQKGP